MKDAHMTRFASLRHATVLAAATLAMLAAPLAQAGGPQSRPFKATLTTQETLGYDGVACPGTIVLGTTTGQGNASHLGKVSLLATDCPVFPPGGLPFASGVLVLTAANGDKLKANYTVQLSPTSATSFSLDGNYAINGGTGRFQGATGTGSLRGSIDTAGGPGSYEATGSLSY